MSFRHWDKKKAIEFIDFNPKECITKKSIAKKIAMDKIQPFTKFIHSYEISEFKGGTKFKNGDTLFARITPCLENGKTSQVNILEKDEVGFGSTEFIVLREKDNISDKDFIYYLAISPKFRDIAIKSMVGSSGRQRVQQNVIEETEFLLPSLPEQKAISSILSALDDKIELNNKMNKNLEEMAQAIFKSWFVNFEPFQNGEFVESELGLIPKGWRVGTLGELVTIKYGKDHKKLNDGDIPVYGSGGIMRYVDRPIYTYESVLIPRKGTLNNVIYVNEPFWSVDTMFFTKMNQKNIAKFIYFFVKSRDLLSMNSGSAVPSMTSKILNSLLLCIPPNNVLNDFENIVAPIFLQNQQNIKENKNIISIRDTLLPKLMNGEIRVPLEVE